jgi:hypothetical protein
MKKILTGLSITLFILVIAFTAFAQKNEKKNNKKEQPQANAKKQDKQPGNSNGNQGNKNQDKKAGKNDDQGNNDKNKGNGNNDNNGKGNNGKGNNGNDDGGSNGKNKNNGNNSEGYSWNKENFKERKKLKNQEKVTVCHKFNSNNEPAVTINVSSNAVKAHMNHGDVMGTCPAVADNRFSDDYLRRRAAYYNDLQQTQEQVYYSRSILDYAIERLTNSRVQLATLRTNNVPVVEIQRKEAVIVELERNVSLLETVLGVAANLVVQKLTN